MLHGSSEIIRANGSAELNSRSGIGLESEERGLYVVVGSRYRVFSLSSLSCIPTSA